MVLLFFSYLQTIKKGHPLKNCELQDDSPGASNQLVGDMVMLKNVSSKSSDQQSSNVDAFPKKVDDIINHLPARDDKKRKKKSSSASSFSLIPVGGMYY